MRRRRRRTGQPAAESLRHSLSKTTSRAPLPLQRLYHAKPSARTTIGGRECAQNARAITRHDDSHLSAPNGAYGASGWYGNWYGDKEDNGDSR